MLLCFINIKQDSEMSLFDQMRSVEEPKKCKQRFANTQQLYHVYRFPFNTSVVGFRGFAPTGEETYLVLDFSSLKQVQ